MLRHLFRCLCRSPLIFLKHLLQCSSSESSKVLGTEHHMGESFIKCVLLCTCVNTHTYISAHSFRFKILLHFMVHMDKEENKRY